MFEKKINFLKVYNKLGKFRTSRPLFSWRNSLLKKVQAHGHIVPPAQIGLIDEHKFTNELSALQQAFLTTK